MTDNFDNVNFSGPYDTQACFDYVWDVVFCFIVFERQQMDNKLLSKLQGIL